MTHLELVRQISIDDESTIHCLDRHAADISSMFKIVSRIGGKVSRLRPSFRGSDPQPSTSTIPTRSSRRLTVNVLAVLIQYVVCGFA